VTKESVNAIDRTLTIRRLGWCRMIGVIAALAASTYASGQDTDAALMKALDARFHRHLERIEAPGFSVAVVHNGQTVFAQGYGRQQIDKPGPMSPDTLLAIGSVSKSFTALLVLQFVEEQGLNLDSRVVDHLPWFRAGDKSLSDQITLRHLLTMTSGLEARFDDLTRIHDASPKALENSVRRLRSYRMLDPPGERFLYVNENWNILGLVLQTISGQSFETLLESRIFNPLGMTHTSGSRSTIVTLGPQFGHYHGAPPRPASFLHLRSSVPAGSGIYSTANDMARYITALLADDDLGIGSPILSADGKATLWEGAIPMSVLPWELGGTGNPGQYAMGWMRMGVHGRNYAFHGGEFRLSSSLLLLDPEHRDGVFLLYNTGNLDPYQSEINLHLADSVMRLLQNQADTDFAVPRQGDPYKNSYTPELQVSSMAGSYLAASGDRLELSPGGSEGLRAFLYHVTYPTSYDLDFVNDSNFIARNSGGALEGSLVRDGNRRLQSVVIAGKPYHRQHQAQGIGSIYQPEGAGFRVAFPEGWTLRDTENGVVALAKNTRSQTLIRLTEQTPGRSKPESEVLDQSDEYLYEFEDAIAGYHFRGEVTKPQQGVQQLCMTTSYANTALEFCLQSESESLSTDVIRYLNPSLSSLRFDD